MSITIKTRLNPGIANYGGQTITHFEYRSGPRNLLLAIAALHLHRKRMRDQYGSDGAGRSWLEINDVPIPDYDLDHVIEDGRFLGDIDRPESKTVKARALIMRVVADKVWDMYRNNQPQEVQQ